MPPLPTAVPVDVPVLQALLEQHRAARLDQIRAFTVPDTLALTDDALRRRVLEEARLTLLEIDVALARLHEGSIDTCTGCTGRIDPDRLYAVPYTRYCARCAGG